VPIPIGTAVHTGVAFVGATGLGTTVDDFRALGDAVSITARLASAAIAGEVIVSVATAEAAGIATDQLERRTVEIRGRTEPIEVIVLPAVRQKVSPDEPMSERPRRCNVRPGTVKGLRRQQATSSSLWQVSIGGHAKDRPTRPFRHRPAGISDRRNDQCALVFQDLVT
jgi:hypothetical protein